MGVFLASRKVDEEFMLTLTVGTPVGRIGLSVLSKVELIYL